MKDLPHGSVGPAGEHLLELLHREQEGALTSAEQHQLDERKADPEVQSARTALCRAVMFLSGPNPPLPRSVAADVAAQIHLSAQLTSPPLPRSVASSVAAEVVLSRQLPAPPVMPHSVAATVSAEIQMAQVLGAAPVIPVSVAASVLADIALSRQLEQLKPVAVPQHSVAASLALRMAQDRPGESGVPGFPTASTPGLPLAFASQRPALLAEPLPVQSGAPPPLGRAAQSRPRNPAPLLLLGGLLAGVTLLTLTTAWPNLAAGAVVLHALLDQVSPLAGVGLSLLLLTSALVTWKPTPQLRTAGAGAFALAATLTIPALYNVAGGGRGLTVGQNVTVSGLVRGNVIAIAGNVELKPQARVEGEVVTLLGDVHRDHGAQVGGHVNALLGQAPGDEAAIQTRPVSDLSLATAAAFRPMLGWLGAAAWPRIFVALTGGLLLLLFVAGVAPVLARKQRHAPIRTLSLGVLLLSALILPALGLALIGWLAPALLGTALVTLLLALGLSVSVYDAGRTLAYRMHLPVPDVAGALLGLSAFAASLSYAPLAFTLALVGGAWGAGTLLLSRRQMQTFQG
ncbi:polymer-forming cytoskeletal protein [Deinococcus sp.]|uniref:polymer-forming cytoskeletal protein n=1 Tax=Deinococcus sp. TaxID=47478 RepID=UPI0025BB8039|nr:polymer-forming cytoskeletal protein [Deinococcus sp.]